MCGELLSPALGVHDNPQNDRVKEGFVHRVITHLANKNDTTCIHPSLFFAFYCLATKNLSSLHSLRACATKNNELVKDAWYETNELSKPDRHIFLHGMSYTKNSLGQSSRSIKISVGSQQKNGSQESDTVRILAQSL